jgi:hypothetical protein
LLAVILCANIAPSHERSAARTDRPDRRSKK